MAKCVINKVVIQKEISKKVYVLTLSEREARELVLIVGSTTGKIAGVVFDSLDVHFPNRPMSVAHYDYIDIGSDALRWAAEGDND